MAKGRIRIALLSALSLFVALLTPGEAQAAWSPDTGSWPTFRHNLEHTGEAEGTSAFTAGQGGFSRVKWQKDISYPVAGPVTVADLDEDGTPEVVPNSADVAVQINPPNVNFEFHHKVEAREGNDGAPDWAQDEPDSFIFAIPGDNAEIDNDDKGEVVYFRGNPLLNVDDEELVARSHTGAQQWQYQDADWNDLGEQIVGILSGVHTANVDNEATHKEVVFAVDEALLTVAIGTQEPGCPNAGAPSADIEATSISYFIHALNGEGGSANEQWQFTRADALLLSTPVITDLNGDGKNDVVFGSGTPEGNLLGECEVHVSVDASAVDDKVVALDGNNPGAILWEKEINDADGTDRPPAATPLVAGTTAGGDPILALLIPVPKTLPPAQDPDRNVLIALNGRTGAELWRLDLKPATIAPLAAADLDGDGQPEVIAQVGNRLATFDNRTGANHWVQGDGNMRGIAYDRTLTAAGVSVADLDSDGTLEIATILEGEHDGAPAAELLIVSGDNGAEEWRTTITGDAATGGPVIADVDQDDDLLEIVVGTGNFTVTDAVDHTGKVFVFEPNAADLAVDDISVIGSELVNEPQTIRATIRNAGTRDANGAVFRVSADGTQLQDHTVNLAAGASTTVDTSWTPTTPGNHSLEVTGDPAGAFRELNEENNTRTETFRVKQKPNAAFTFSPAAPDEDDVVQFTDRSIDDRTIVSWSWSCTDGFTSTQQNPTHDFVDGGNWSCTLTVTDDDDLTDSETKPVTVTHVPPNAHFTHEVVNPGEVQFTDASTHTNPADAPPTGWTFQWDFENDGVFDSTQRNPFHDFGVNEGLFDVRLRVTDNDGQVDDVVITIDVGIVNQPPTANFTFSPFMGVQGSEMTFTDQSSDSDGQIVKIEIDWESDGVIDVVKQGANVAGSQFKHGFTGHADFAVFWRVTDNRGATAVKVKTIHNCVPPGHIGPGIGGHFCAAV